jgi:hypothetical protein
MKYLIGSHGWEVRQPGIGRRFLEPGTLVDQALPYWSFVVGQGPPIDAVAYDQAAYDMMVASPVNGGLGYDPARVQFYPTAGIVPVGAVADWWSDPSHLEPKR